MITKSPRKIDRNLAFKQMLECNITPDYAAWYVFTSSDWKLYNSNVGYI